MRRIIVQDFCLCFLNFSFLFIPQLTEIPKYNIIGINLNLIDYIELTYY